MKAVNISTLRAELSSLLDAVRNGSTVEILDRNVPIARLVPMEPTSQARNKNELPGWLAKLARSGVVRLGTGKPVAEILKWKPTGRSSGVLDALLEERRTGR